MSGFKAGKVDRDRLGIVRHLAPVQSVHALIDITPEELIAAGKKLILVDVDNTLVVWRSEHVPESTMSWLGFMKGAGLKICILSNTRRPARLERLSKEMDIPYRRGRFKPSRRMYLQALKDFGVTAKETVMIGDQLFTDVLGANRTGIDAIWVEQMAPRDFVGTKISRFGERLIRGRIHKAMKTEKVSGAPEEDLPIGGTAAFELLSNPTVRQFVKFCIVGGTSTVIDIGLFWIMRFYLRSGDQLLSESLGSYLMSHFPGIFAPLEVWNSNLRSFTSLGR